MEQGSLTGVVIGCAIEVHRNLGPGLLESTYQGCLAHELQARGIRHHVEHPLPVEYKGCRIDCGYRVDLLVQDSLIVELKAVDQTTRIHQSQVLTYMRLSGIDLGLLINFNVRRLIDGVKRFRL